MCVANRAPPDHGGADPCSRRFQSLYLYGAVEPTTGQSFFLELPALNSSLFQLFLEQLAATAPTHFHLLVLDNGAFHKAHSLRLQVLFLPPYAPELNPTNAFGAISKIGSLPGSLPR